MVTSKLPRMGDEGKKLDLFFQPLRMPSRQSISTNFSSFTVLITLLIKISTKDLEMEYNSDGVTVGGGDIYI